MRSPTASIVSAPSAIVPALMSMSSDRRWKTRLFETTLMTGATACPTTEPAPVVKTIMCAPLATISVMVCVSLMFGMP